MATILEQVRPGDPISSDLFNRMIAMLNDHDSKLSGVGGGGTGNLISGFDPPAEQNVGKTLAVFGNFDFPLVNNTLSIDGIPIAPTEFLSGSNNTQLLFKIPASIVVAPGASRGVILRVVNSKGSGERTYSLRPQVAGQPDPTMSGAVDNTTNVTPLLSERQARITGLNFAGPAVKNAVRLIFNPGPGQTAFPPILGDSLTVDPSASVINPAPQESTLVVMMPAVGPALIPIVGQSAPATLELTATGANNPALLTVQIRRTA